MRLQVGGVDHHRPGRRALGGQLLDEAVEHARLAPANETVVERLVGAVAGWCVAPHQARADDVDDAADDLAIVDPPHTAHLVGQKRLNTSELSVGKPEMVVGHENTLYVAAFNHITTKLINRL